MVSFAMADRVIVTPFFIDKPVAELEALTEEGGLINRPNQPPAKNDLTATDEELQEARMLFIRNSAPTFAELPP